jgi:hypothetical protein
MKILLLFTLCLWTLSCFSCPDEVVSDVERSEGTDTNIPTTEPTQSGGDAGASE